MLKNPTIKDLIELARRTNNVADCNRIRKAYRYAKEKHKDQKRKSGEPYIIHPLNVAYIVAQMGLDSATICAALLHDVVEDTDTVYENIEEEFSSEIAELVEGVTKLTNIFKSPEERQAENYKKLFNAMEKDIRVILLKIADRLHNVHTLAYLERKKQIAIAKETIDIYAPIANKLGMFEMKNSLEEQAFKYLKPEKYDKILKEVEELKNRNINLLKNTKKQIERLCKKHKVMVQVYIEKKPTYSIYKKIDNNQESISEMKDLFAIRVIVKNKSDCYIVMGILMEYYQFIPKTFKDYISVPRNNMYQALESILMGEEGIVFELKICSQAMNQISKYGILAYFNSIQNDNLKDTMMEEKLIGIKEALELENLIQSPKIFLQTLKSELYEEEIYVFTPKGELIILPKGAIVIDFAYKIGEEIGNTAIGAKVNGKNIPIIIELKEGDIIEVIVENNHAEKERKNLNDMSFNLIHIVKTAKAKNGILKKIFSNIKKDKKEEISKNEKNTKKFSFQVSLSNEEDMILNLAKQMKNMGYNILSVNTEQISDKDININIEAEESKKEIKN